MGNQMIYLSQPDTDCYSEDGLGKTFIYGAAIMQGWRKHQEDRLICLPRFHNGYSFFGVYDGHGGEDVSEYLKRELHLYVERYLNTCEDVELAIYLGFLSCDESIIDYREDISAMTASDSRAVYEAIKSKMQIEGARFIAENLQAGNSAGSSRESDGACYMNAGGSSEVDKPVTSKADCSTKESSNSDQDEEEDMEEEKPYDFLLNEDYESSDPEDDDYSVNDEETSSCGESEEEVTPGLSPVDFLNAQPGDLSGSTATIAVISATKIYVANVGDSRCVMSRKGQALDMSLDHKPEDPDESSRIAYAGGSISEDGRVNNCLNLSRAFGDFKFKNGTSAPPEQPITAEPFVKSFDVDSDDDFLIIASDGIWNSMSSQEVVDFVNVRLQAAEWDLTDICHDLFRLIVAVDKDNDGTGCDNMSCIIVKFGGSVPCFSELPSASAKEESLAIEGDGNATTKQVEDSEESSKNMSAEGDGNATTKQVEDSEECDKSMSAEGDGNATTKHVEDSEECYKSMQ